MAANTFGNVPTATPVKPEPLTYHVPEENLQDFRTLLKLSKIGPRTWWNQEEVNTDNRFGISRKWLIDAKETWLNGFDWRKHEDYINSFPNFKISVRDRETGRVDAVHFAALFSKRRDAIPLILLHGFPASFTEFLPVLDSLKAKYTPENLPYHVIVPSLPDYGLSVGTSCGGGDSSDESIPEMTLGRAARIMNQLMVDLEFGDGYVAQGGDLGSFIARLMAVEYEACKAFHLNMLFLNPDQTAPSRDVLSSEELQMLERSEAWQQTGMAFVLEHATRPSTVGLAVSTNPLAMLAWVGEKLQEWTGPRTRFSLDTILASITLYWFTGTFPRSLYHANIGRDMGAGKMPPISMTKPMGYSLFTHDVAVLPRPWAHAVYPNLEFFRSHDEGGHFASVERPKEFLEDVEEFVAKVGKLFGAAK